MSYDWWRCQTCGALRHSEELNRGECSGHKIVYATNGTLIEWLRIKLYEIKKYFRR